MTVIGIDGNEANVSRHVGVSVYTLNLLKYFRKHSTRETRFVVYLREPPNGKLPEPGPYFKYRVVPGRFLWSQVFLPLALRIDRGIDVFFSPAHYAPRFSPVPVVVTIHDLAYKYYPGDFRKSDLMKLENWTGYSVKNAAGIIAVSNTTKNDIIRNYGIPAERIAVVYNGFEKNIKGEVPGLKLPAGELPYILYVGTLQPRKNLETLLEAFAVFRKSEPGYQLFVAGKKGWMYDYIFEKTQSLNLADDVFFTDYITDKQLAFLYKNAFCLVMPSYYEGFGIPVIEAMSFGCPVISSFASSLPEVGGDACLYFDPKSADDLTAKLLELRSDPGLRRQLISKGKSRIRQFSWNESSRQTLEILKDVASRG